MANALITPAWITNTTLKHLKNNSAFIGNVNTDYNDEFAKAGAKMGTTINVRRPVRAQVRSGATAVLQDVNETQVPITIEPEFGIDWAFTDFDNTLSVDKFEERYCAPFGSQLAAELDLRIGQRFYKAVANFSGTPGTGPATAAAALAAGAVLDNNSCPRDGRNRVFALNPLANAGMVGGLSGFFNDQNKLSSQYKKGMMGVDTLGMDFQMSQNLPTHTVGGLGGTPLVNGANQGTINSGATDNPYAATTSLITDGWTAAAANRLKAGDVFTIAGVNAVNLVTKQDLGVLQNFVVTADVSSDGLGNLTAVISPAIIAGGAYQNVTARPADNAALTIKTGTASTGYSQNMLFHPSAMALVTVPMDVPNGMDMAHAAEYEGVNLRFVRGFDITNNKRISRFDILAGYGCVRPEWAVRVPS
ncbi:MAG: hypothetical protein HYX42_04045 [Polaromonas sp.]|uniref:P22 phage major capsid protein family protein n=1 Tax=Polaromonas sp. TaxID=1869339 RepID=UPI0025E24DA8|nr:P22 phage major capsid protein family protein [Polaromonas sp.]MBI2725402.1 hypothetical protein [Polaromonas sp.]